MGRPTWRILNSAPTRWRMDTCAAKWRELDKRRSQDDPDALLKSLMGSRLAPSSRMARAVLEKASKNWSAGRGGTLPGLPILAAGGIVPPAFSFRDGFPPGRFRECIPSRPARGDRRAGRPRRRRRQQQLEWHDPAALESLDGSNPWLRVVVDRRASPCRRSRRPGDRHEPEVTGGSTLLRETSRGWRVALDHGVHGTSAWRARPAPSRREPSGRPVRAPPRPGCVCARLPPRRPARPGAAPRRAPS
jgi:hypothetical protein